MNKRRIIYINEIERSKDPGLNLYLDAGIRWVWDRGELYNKCDQDNKGICFMSLNYDELPTPDVRWVVVS